jgi:hypothetical protein
MAYGPRRAWANEGVGVGTIVAVAGHVAAGLVLVAGLGKLLRPTVTRDALALSRLPAASWLVRLLGAGEIALAVTVLVIGGPVAFAALAVAYAGFIGVAEHQRRAGRGCGCFGAASSTAVGPLHLGVDAFAALAAGAAAWLATPGLPRVLPAEVLAGGVALGLVVAAVVLGQLMLTALPELMAVRSTAAAGSRP